MHNQHQCCRVQNVKFLLELYRIRIIDSFLVSIWTLNCCSSIPDAHFIADLNSCYYLISLVVLHVMHALLKVMIALWSACMWMLQCYASCSCWVWTSCLRRAQCTTSKVSSVCFDRVRPTWSSPGQTVLGEWAESHRGSHFQVCVSAAIRAVQIYWALWAYYIKKKIMILICCVKSSVLSLLNNETHDCPHHCCGKTWLLIWLVTFYILSQGRVSLAHKASKMPQGTDVTLLYLPLFIRYNKSICSLSFFENINDAFLPFQTSSLWLGFPLCEQRWQKGEGISTKYIDASEYHCEQQSSCTWYLIIKANGSWNRADSERTLSHSDRWRGMMQHLC